MARFPEPEKLSLRKRFCLSWLRWKLTRKREDAQTMVDLAKEFRVAEDRVGQKRTLIEKRARRHFKELRKIQNLAPSREAAKKFAQGQFERGEGIHSPEQVALRAERNRRNRQKQIELQIFAMDWVITDPQGVEFRIRSLERWCKKTGNFKSNLHRTSTHGGTSKGYKLRRYNEDLDSHIPWEHELE